MQLNFISATSETGSDEQRHTSSHVGQYPQNTSAQTGCMIRNNRCFKQLQKLYTTGGKGSFGSRNDEERSEMRNVARYAKPARRRVFERSMRPRSNPQACLSGCFDHSSGQLACHGPFAQASGHGRAVSGRVLPACRRVCAA